MIITLLIITNIISIFFYKKLDNKVNFIIQGEIMKKQSRKIGFKKRVGK